MKDRSIQKSKSAEYSIFFGLFLSLWVLGFPHSAQATPGNLDPSFGTGGKVTTAVGLVDDVVYGVVTQPDGKLVTAGYANNGARQIFALVRYNTDGSLDTSFGTGGKVTTSIGAEGDVVFTLVIQSDGKLVAGGYTAVGAVGVDDERQFALVRYNTDGSLDTSFGTGGKVTTAIGTYDVIYGLIVRPDGKLVAGGYAYDGNLDQYEFALVRYNTDGSLDTSFGTGGKVTTTIGTFDDEINSLGTQPDGKIVAAGYTYNFGQDQYNIALVRYNTDGSVDTSFGTGGVVTTTINMSDDVASSLAIQPDGKVVVGGHSWSDDLGQYVFAMVRYNNDGSLDTTFGTGSKVTTPVGGGDENFTVGLQVDGKLVAAGYTFDALPGQYSFAMVRYNSDGSLDTSFGTGGKVVTSIGGVDDEAYTMTIQPTGKIVAAGYTFDADAVQYKFAVVRYLGGLTITMPVGSAGCAADYNGTCAFAPNPLTIESGDSVVWSNADTVSHTATSDDHADTFALDQPIAPANSFSTAVLSGGGSSGSIGPFINTSGTAQTKLYHCSVHPNMKGTLIINSGGGGTSTTTTTTNSTTSTTTTTTSTTTIPTSTTTTSTTTTTTSTTPTSTTTTSTTTASTTTTTTILSGSDLTVSALSTATVAVSPGGKLSLSSTVNNQGSSSAGSSVTAFHLSTDTIYGGSDDIAISATRSVSSLKAGASNTGKTNVVVPSTIPLGSYHVCAMADSKSKIVESNEANNTLCSAGTIQVTRPDLVMSAVNLGSGTINPGAKFSVSNTVENQGALSSGSSIITFHLSTNTVYGDGDDVVMTTTRSTGTLAAGASNSATTSLTIPKTTPAGSYYVCAMADSKNKIVETNEVNNTLCSVSQVTVPRPDLIMSAVTPSTGTVNTGGKLSVSNTVENQGALSSGSSIITFHLSTNTVYGDGDDVVMTTTRSTGTLAAGASNSATTSLTIPKTTPAGSYYVCAMADSKNKIVETNEVNNTLCSSSQVMVIVE